jgi:hypothetical protein
MKQMKQTGWPAGRYAALIAAAVALGCGPSSGGFNGGSGGGGTATRGAQCMQVLDVVCARFAGCGFITAADVATCVQAGVEACCVGNCAASVLSSQAEIDICTADLMVVGCESLDLDNGGDLPSRCQGVVHAPLTAGSAPQTGPGGGAATTLSRAGQLISR